MFDNPSAADRDRLRPNHIAVRTRVRRRAPLKLTPLLITQYHLVRRALRHRHGIRRQHYDSFKLAT
jgi:hypothetical protein